MKTRVSGVPYEVELREPLQSNEDTIAELERENFMMRARMDRLEDELRTSNELLTKAHIDLANLRNKARYYEEND